MIGASAGLTLRYVGLLGRPEGSRLREALMAACTSRAAPSMSRDRSNCSVIRDEPSELDEVISVEIGHHVGAADEQNLSQMWELENKRSKSLDEVGAGEQRAISSIKDYIFQWNMTLFPSDQLSNQIEAFQSLQKSSLQNPLKDRDSLQKNEDPFAGLNEED